MYAVQRVDARIRASVWLWVFGTVAYRRLVMDKYDKSRIVEALRHCDGEYIGGNAWDGIFTDAADEIERLQSKLAKIRVIVDSGYCDPYDLRKILDIV